MLRQQRITTETNCEVNTEQVNTKGQQANDRTGIKTGLKPKRENNAIEK